MLSTNLTNGRQFVSLTTGRSCVAGAETNYSEQDTETDPTLHDTWLLLTPSCISKLDLISSTRVGPGVNVIFTFSFHCSVLQLKLHFYNHSYKNSLAF